MNNANAKIGRVSSRSGSRPEGQRRASHEASRRGGGARVSSVHSRGVQCTQAAGSRLAGIASLASLLLPFFLFFWLPEAPGWFPLAMASIPLALVQSIQCRTNHESRTKARKGTHEGPGAPAPRRINHINPGRSNRTTKQKRSKTKKSTEHKALKKANRRRPPPGEIAAETPE